MELSYILYLAKKFIINYFNIFKRTARKEFNFSLLIYSLICFSVLATFYHSEKDRIMTEVRNKADVLMLSTENIKTSEQANKQVEMLLDGLDISMGSLSYLVMFATLLLLPLYIRRINDTFLHPAFAAPLVFESFFNIVIVILGSPKMDYGLLDAISFYNFILMTALCIIPSAEEYEEV